MKKIREIKSIFKAEPVREGAGVNLKRVFGYHQIPQFDPFLLMDEFHSNDPDDYKAGFPWHPHRGIETISYVLNGSVEHGDSMGNEGVVSSGDVQWMTAGNGIIHQEMPRGEKDNLLWGFQVWANLPAGKKMMGPRYQDIRKDQIPSIESDNGVTIKVICGQIGSVTGPVTDLVIDPEMLDVAVPPDTPFIHPTKPDYTAFVYIYDGLGRFPDSKAGKSRSAKEIQAGTAVLFHHGGEISLQGGTDGVRLLLLAGKPIGEPVAWAGPIVMNTRRELRTAFQELEQNTFIKHT